MAGIKKIVSPLRLRANKCEIFDVIITLAEQDFLYDLFVESLPSDHIKELFQERRRLDAPCSRQNKKIDYRALVDIHPFKEKSKSPEMHFHVTLSPTTAVKKKDEPPPFAEDIFQWLHNFIAKHARIEVWESAAFQFPSSSYGSAFFLPLKLSGPANPIDSDIFEGSEMVGVRVKLPPNRVNVQFAQQSVSGKSISVELRRKSTDTSAEKLMTIENDVPILSKLAEATVIKRRKR